MNGFTTYLKTLTYLVKLRLIIIIYNRNQSSLSMIVMVHSYYSVTLLDESSNESLGVHNFFRSFSTRKRSRRLSGYLSSGMRHRRFLLSLKQKKDKHVYSTWFNESKLIRKKERNDIFVNGQVDSCQTNKAHPHGVVGGCLWPAQPENILFSFFKVWIVFNTMWSCLTDYNPWIWMLMQLAVL